MNSVLSTISAHINSDTGLIVSTERMLSNFTMETQDHQHRIVVNHIASLDAPYPIHWAAMIKSGDPCARYRTYTQHIGIRQTSAYELSVHIASTSSDHLGGRFAAFRPPLKRVSPLVERFFTNADIRCVTGSHVLLSKSIRLTNQSVEYFLNLLYEKSRALPVILITCPDIVSPDLLHSYLLGNAIVSYTGDSGMIMLLNDYLPEPLRITFGSIRVYVPFDSPSGSPAFHPSLPLSDIYRISSSEVINILYRAYAENFRKQELRSFISLDTCANLRTQQYISSLKKQLAASLENEKSSEDKYIHLHSEFEHFKSEVSSNRDKPSTDADYEALLAEYTSELEQIKNGIQYLISQTYSSKQIIDIPDDAHALIVDLIKSVNFRQMCPRSKSHKTPK